MGLDMYLTGRKYVGGSLQGDDEPFREEDGKPVDSMNLELGYWRKHRKLHGYIVNTFAEGKDECQKINLEGDDLRKIAKAVRTNDLPNTEGFFFGCEEIDNTYSNEAEEHAQQFDEAAKWLEDGDWKRTVFYRASW